MEKNKFAVALGKLKKNCIEKKSSIKKKSALANLAKARAIRSAVCAAKRKLQKEFDSKAVL